MPRKPLLRSAIHPYHVVNRSRNKDWYEIPMETLWYYCKRSLKESLIRHPVKLHAFVLMKNHYHLLLTTPECNLDKFMYEFNKRLSMAIRYRSKRINQIFGGRYKWCLVDNDEYLLNVYRYIYQNPVKAQLCQNIFDYHFSTLKHPTWIKELKISVHYNEANSDFMKWLNKYVSSTEHEGIQRAMRGEKFKIRPIPSSRRILNLKSFEF